MPRSPRAGSEKLPLPIPALGEGIHRIAQSIQPFRQNVLLQRLVALYAVVWLVTAIRPFNRQDWILENLPVFVAVPALVANGIQGDVWDAQKDMGLALAGAILCMAVTAALQWKSSLLSGADRAPSQDRM